MKTNLIKVSLRLLFLTLLLCSTFPAFAQNSALRLNGKIAYSCERDGNKEIYVKDADGVDNQVRLTHNSGVDDYPTWSPDGTKIAFVGERSTGGFGIFIMNADGTNQTEITPTTYNPWSGPTLSWSPDGKKIAFQDVGQIFVINVDGSGREEITHDANGGSNPTWSPDGSKILFVRNDGLYTINPDGSGLSSLQNGNDWGESSPDWSPTGNQIVFGVNDVDLEIANPDGTGRQLFYECGFNNSCDGAVTPAFSPDGTKIVFGVYSGNTIRLWVKNVDGTGLFLMVTGSSPSWQPLAPAACPNPIDCSDLFVRQQYRDFLSRDAEPSGLQFYLEILNGCNPSDSECIHYTRGALSANFFRSPEFGGKGAYVANLFNIVIGQRPKTVGELNDASKSERPHYGEFTSDLATLSAPTDTETNLKKDQLAVTWLGRTEVQSILPSSLTNQQFVQKLETIAGVTLANENSLIANLESGAMSRAQVLRAIAESPEVIAKFYLQNFVTMEYFGYLRRDPEDCHASMDPSNCGYIFHNSRFSTPGADPDLIENIIVRGFIESPEYRGRFGLP